MVPTEFRSDPLPSLWPAPIKRLQHPPIHICLSAKEYEGFSDIVKFEYMSVYLSVPSIIPKEQKLSSVLRGQQEMIIKPNAFPIMRLNFLVIIDAFIQY